MSYFDLNAIYRFCIVTVRILFVFSNRLCSFLADRFLDEYWIVIKRYSLNTLYVER